MFPVGSTAHFFRLCELTQERLGQKELGWDLWWDGYPVSKEYWWRPLEHAAKNWDRDLAVTLTAVGSRHRMDVSEAGLNAVEATTSASATNQKLKQVHRRLKSTGLGTFTLTMTRVACGKFDPIREWSTPEERTEENEALVKGLGLHNGNADRLRESIGLPALDHPADTALAWLATCLANKGAAAGLRAGGEKAAVLARDELRQLRSILITSEKEVRSRSVNAPMSLNTLHTHLTANRKAAAVEIIVWVCMGAGSLFRENVRSTIAQYPCSFNRIAAESLP